LGATRRSSGLAGNTTVIAWDWLASQWVNRGFLETSRANAGLLVTWKRIDFSTSSAGDTLIIAWTRASSAGLVAVSWNTFAVDEFGG